MKLTKKDKQYWIQFDQANRDYLSNISMFLMTFLISITALMISVLSLIYSINGINKYSIIVTFVFAFILLLTWIKFLPPVKRGISDSKRVNEQLQKELFDLYPEYKNRIH